MKTRLSCFTTLLLSLLVAANASATQVTNTTQSALMTALSGGGTVTFGIDGTFNLTNTLVISTNVTLDGAGHAISISGSNAVRVFFVNPGINFTLNNLSVVNGSVTGTNGSNFTSGAGIYNNAGTVTSMNCVFSNNAVLGNNANQSSTTAAGGAIFNQTGTLSITNCTFITNSAIGGPHYGGYPGNGLGGAICSLGGSMSLNGDVFCANNSSGGSDAGVGPFAGGTLGSGLGGALYCSNGVMVVLACRLTDNSALGSVGLSSASDENGGAAVGGAICQLGGSLTMIQTDVATNSVLGGSIGWYYGYGGSGFGGGLFNSGVLNVTNCTFSGNSVTGGGDGTPPGDGDGGGLYNMGTATLVNISLAGNYVISGQSGEGSFGQAGLNGSANGGGIFNSNVLVLLASTLSSNLAIGTPGVNTNSAAFGPASGATASGGGIFNLGLMHATNITFLGNSSIGGTGIGEVGGVGQGGAFYNGSGTATLAFQTMFSNSAPGGIAPYGGGMGPSYGGGIFATNGTVTLYNSIVASNAPGGDFYVLSNSLTDGGNNLSSDNSFPFTMPGSHNNVNPLLGPLANNGGPTLTVALLPGSPAIDAASSASSTPTDQRGLPRPYGSASDIGAFEYYPSYTIQGMVRGLPPAGSATVSAGIFSGTTDSSGNYMLNSLTNGIYTVIPSMTGFVFVPASQNVSVGPSASNVNFSAYQLNALTVESYANGILHLAFAGTNGQVEVVQSTSTLSNWSPILTNTVGANGIFEFTITNGPGQPMQFFRAHSL